ncbi:hypothetical protein AK812_SmicGene19574 [Symbiodinium microadriaticum]|uniref:Uncharacterized protein n=1 Tax=Symbiodinium microadriaticum TaxID=2951 RepID=A0A1Q9DS58_SYMMI|nr:hypothetical protein AK812_SmicGene19574 [Symbiodinium microadriaticum]
MVTTMLIIPMTTTDCFFTELLWVDVPFEELSKIVDVAERMKNWTESSGELEEAKEDLRGDLKACVEDDPIASCGCMLSGSILWKIYQWAYYTNNFEAVIGPLVMKKIEPKGNAAPDGARPPSPSAGSRRKLRIGPWKRDDTVTRRKNARLAYLDRRYKGDREYYVDKYVLGSRDVLLERNRFPYQLPPGAEHWTIWCRHEMGHQELCDYVEAWLDAREPHHVVSWNYDDNRGRRTINIWHVHIYFQGRGGLPPRLTCPSSLERSLKRSKCEDRLEPAEKRRRVSDHCEMPPPRLRLESPSSSPRLSKARSMLSVCKRSPCSV